MKTEDLARMLASGVSAIDQNAATRRYVIALGLGILGAAILMTSILGVRPDLPSAVGLPMFWVKVAFVAVLALASGVVTRRLAHPGWRVGWAPALLIAPVVALWLLAAYVLVAADAAQRPDLIFGRTSSYCPLLIATLAVPPFVAMMWAMRGLAPTRLRLAGGSAGLVSGALGALVYTLHCAEMAAPFIGLWYLLGILIPSVAGALIGPRVLRW